MQFVTFMIADPAYYLFHLLRGAGASRVWSLRSEISATIIYN